MGEDMISNQQPKGTHMRRGITLILIAVTAIFGYPALTHADSHTLVVDGVSYESTKEAGGSIQWETPGPTAATAYFAERDQSWVYGDNGTDHLPCPYGIHWVSNDNVLTISHCLEAPPSTSTTTSIPATSTTTLPPTSTTSPTTTTTLPGSTTSTSTSTLAPTTTVAESTSTSSPTTSTEPSTTASPTTSPSFAATTTLPPSSPTTTVAPKIPVTGSGDLAIAIAALILVVIGGAMLLARRAT